MHTNLSSLAGKQMAAISGKSALLTVALSAALLLSACGSGETSQSTPEDTAETRATIEVSSTAHLPATPEVKIETPEKTPDKAGSTAEGTAESASVPASKTPQGFDLPKGAYPQAGGPIPAEATELTVVHESEEGKIAVFKTPTGNIGCDLGYYDMIDEGGCGIYDIQNPPLVEMPGDGKQKANWADFSEPEGAFPAIKTDIAMYMRGDKPAEVVPYGKVVYYRQFVCASEKAGLTCWNTKSGHGVFMNRKTMEFF